MEVNGVEPLTLCLQSRCSSQLSYTPEYYLRWTRFEVRWHLARELLLTRTIVWIDARADESAGADEQFCYSRKEIIQPHLPVRLPCYDLAPVTSFALGAEQPATSGTPSFHGLTGGVYNARDRIHRIMADIRLLAITASRSRVADSDPN